MKTITKKEMKQLTLRPKPVKYDNIPFWELLNEEVQDEKYRPFFNYDFSPNLLTITDYMIYQSDAFHLENGYGHTTIKSRAKSLDISRVYIYPEYHRQGHGTILMELVLSLILTTQMKHKVELPKIVCECVGSVGGYENTQDMPLDIQVKFFQKFGFELSRIDKYGYYHLVMNEEKMYEYMTNNLKQIK